MLTSTTPTFRIWHPDVYFANARIAQFHEVTQPNFLLWISPNGSILYDTRVSMTVICAMQLQNFPLDSQWCHLRILSCKIWSSCSWKASFFRCLRRGSAYNFVDAQRSHHQEQ